MSKLRSYTANNLLNICRLYSYLNPLPNALPFLVINALPLLQYEGRRVNAWEPSRQDSFLSPFHFLNTFSRSLFRIQRINVTESCILGPRFLSLLLHGGSSVSFWFPCLCLCIMVETLPPKKVYCPFK